MGLHLGSKLPISQETYGSLAHINCVLHCKSEMAYHDDFLVYASDFTQSLDLHHKFRLLVSLE